MQLMIRNLVNCTFSMAFVAVIFISTVFSQELPVRVKSYMAKSYPGWAILEGWNGPDAKRTPAVASGDFDGNGHNDYAVVLKKDDRIYAIVMFVTDRTINAVTLETQKEGVNGWIANVGDWAKGKRVFGRDDLDEEMDITLRTDAVVLIDGEGHGTLYYWKGGDFTKLFGVDEPDEAIGSTKIDVEDNFEKAVRIDARIKTVGLFSNYASMTRNLGKPVSEKRQRPALSECSGETESFMEAKYSGLELQLNGDSRSRNFTVISFQVKNGSWEMQGIRIGSTREEVLRKFGKPFRVPEDSELEKGESGVVYLAKLNEAIGDGSVSFIFKNGKLIRFSAGVDLC